MSLSVAVVSFETNGGSGVTIVISESAGSLVVVLVLSEAVGEEVSVFVLATGTSARGLLNLVCALTSLCSCSFIAGEDFGPSQNYTVTFPAGSTRQSVNIPIINDTVSEPDEIFQLDLSVPEAAVRAGVIDRCDPFTPRRIIEINDDDCKYHNYGVNNKTINTIV